MRKFLLILAIACGCHSNMEPVGLAGDCYSGHYYGYQQAYHAPYTPQLAVVQLVTPFFPQLTYNAYAAPVALQTTTTTQTASDIPAPSFTTSTVTVQPIVLVPTFYHYRGY